MRNSEWVVTGILPRDTAWGCQAGTVLSIGRGSYRGPIRETHERRAAKTRSGWNRLGAAIRPGGVDLPKPRDGHDSFTPAEVGGNLAEVPVHVHPPVLV